MAPAEPLTELEGDHKPQNNINDNDIKSSLENSAMKGLSCNNNCEDAVTGIKDCVRSGNKSSYEADIDVIERGNSSDVIFAETEDPNATEYSSSFDGTVDDAENFAGISEGEVESQHIGDDNGFGPAFDRVFPTKKRKLTDHWRNYIRPIMWRCKWMELRMKELDMQVLKYSRELEVYDRGKPLELDQFTSEEFYSKSLPFSSQFIRKKAMKRRKRKRVEVKSDVASYMTQHNFFSYLENKKSDLDNTSWTDEFGNPVTSDAIADSNGKLGADDWRSFESRAGDNSVEQILDKIETLHSRVKKLKGQIDSVMSKNPAKFSSSENLSILAPLEVQTSSVHSPAFSAGNADEISPGAMYCSTQHLTDYDIGDLVLPSSVVSSFGEAIIVPDIIESTVGLLSASDVTLHRPQFVDSNEDIVENVLMHEEVGEGERHTFGIPKQEPELWGQEDVKPCLIPSSSSELPMNNAPLIPLEQSVLKSRLGSDVNFPRYKRKRGERKAGQVIWNKPCSGESDNQ